MLHIGHGFDVHAFGEGRALVLGGVTIAHTHSLLGHSDADVATHALIDALLGAARLDGAGDIGELFPDKDPAFAGANSLDLLSTVARRLADAGFDIIDVDLTIAAQEPKLAPHRIAMRTALAKAMQLPLSAVGVKATTTEQLGFVGRKEGIAAWAVALVDDRQ